MHTHTPWTFSEHARWSSRSALVNKLMMMLMLLVVIVLFPRLLIWFRNIKGFLMQSGDPSGTVAVVSYCFCASVCFVVIVLSVWFACPRCLHIQLLALISSCLQWTILVSKEAAKGVTAFGEGNLKMNLIPNFGYVRVAWACLRAKSFRLYKVALWLRCWLPLYVLFGFQIQHNQRGILSMANSRKPDTNGSQFFLTYAKQPSLDLKHSVFGK